MTRLRNLYRAAQFLGWLVLFLLGGCDDADGPKPDPSPTTTTESGPNVDPRARQAAELMLRDVVFDTGASPNFGFQGCSKNDSLVYKATGLNAGGQRVTVVVCCGWVFRGCTVRVP